MVKLNLGLIALGVIGLVVVLALPIVEAPMVVKLLDVPGGHGAMVLGALAVGAGMGAFNLAVKPVRWTAIVALVAFAIVGMKLSGGDEAGLVTGAGATGGMLIGFVGMVLSLVLAVKPGAKRA